MQLTHLIYVSIINNKSKFLRWSMIYIFEDIDKFNDEYYTSAIKRLSAQRLEYISKFRQARDRHLSVLAYLLLSFGLKLEYNISEPQEFIYSEKGKPYLKKYDDIFFCMSHCKNGVCCAVSDREVGIDIESIREIRPAIIKRVCSDEECVLVKNAALPNREFIRLWTMKEAYLKFTGSGIGVDMCKITEEIPECGNMLFRKQEKYIMTCTQNLKINILSIKELLY